MSARPEIFISATTKDLKSCRQLVRDALLTLGCVPVVQDHFAPEAATVREMLCGRIAKCDAVIHLAGMCFGYEPQERAAGEARRSYTQIEYDIARELKKPLYTFVCAPDFPFDAHEPEDAERRSLQEQHRNGLAGGDRLFLPVRNAHDLEKSVRELRFQVRSWIGRLVAVVVVALGLVGGLLWYLDHRTTAVEGRNTVLQKQNDAQAHEIAGLQARLDEQTRTGQQILAIVQRNASEGKAAEKTDTLAAAQAQVATERGISVEELQKQLAGETTDVRTLLARIEQQSAAARAQADLWGKLQRAALTKLGDGERAAGHYREAVEPYQQALALYDQTQEPLAWCDAAQKLEVALWLMGRYAEAEPLARQLVDRRTTLQGAEHPDTLQGINNLANLLYVKGDMTGAQPLYRQCLEARERTLGPEHPDTLRSVRNLANSLYAVGDLTGAEGLYRRCLETNERTLGPEHPDTLRSVNGLAVLLCAKGDVASAEGLYRRCLEAQERTLGKEHPETLSSVNGLAVLLADKNDLAGAEGLYRRCLEARERLLGKEHPETLQSANNLAVLLKTKGDLAGAETLYRRCLESYERTLGEAHPDTARTACNLSQLQEKRGQFDEALRLAEKAVAAARISLPANHPERRRYEQQLAAVRAKISSAARPTRYTTSQDR